MAGGPDGTPILIAHRAGNHPSKLEAAIAAGADYAEADVWLYRHRLEVRHEKTAGPLPLLWDRWSLRAGWGPRLALEVLLSEAGGGGLLLDLKGTAAELAAGVAAAVEAAGAGDRVAYTGHWWHLDRLADRVPASRRFYTAGGWRRLGALHARLEDGGASAVSVHRGLLTREGVEALRAAGAERIITWPVRTEAEAERVLSWGADGVTSDDLSLLAALRRDADGR